MIVRQLRPDEKKKADILQATAFNFSYDAAAHEGELLDAEAWGAFLDDGETLASMMYPITYESRFGDTYLPALGIGGVATHPQYRRTGGIRAIFRRLFEMAPERGWVSSYLYPFSYDYYRQFGYERVLCRREMRFECGVLGHIPRNTNAVLYEDPAQLPVLLDVYHRYAEQFQIMFRRSADRSAREYSADPHKSLRYTYIWNDATGKGQAYASCLIRDGWLRVSELCYTSPESLFGILGFLRTFEGQVEGFDFTRLPEDTPLDHWIGNYCDVEYSRSSYAMGRVLLPETLLAAHTYPCGISGSFCVCVTEPETSSGAAGVYAVSYAQGKGSVRRLSGGVENADIVCSVSAFSRVLLGGTAITPDTAAYVPGIEVRNPEGAAVFCRAFPHRAAFLHTDF